MRFEDDTHTDADPEELDDHRHGAHSQQNKYVEWFSLHKKSQKSKLGMICDSQHVQERSADTSEIKSAVNFNYVVATTSVTYMQSTELNMGFYIIYDSMVSLPEHVYNLLVWVCSWAVKRLL